MISPAHFLLLYEPASVLVAARVNGFGRKSFSNKRFAVCKYVLGAPQLLSFPDGDEGTSITSAKSEIFNYNKRFVDRLDSCP